jgi:hypothetical protein
VGKDKQPDMEKLCINCEHSTYIQNSDNCVCTKKGLVRADYSCRKFKPDLLKVTPPSPGTFTFDELP